METEVMAAKITGGTSISVRLHNVYTENVAYDGNGVKLNDTETLDRFEMSLKCMVTFPQPLNALVKLGCKITTPETMKELSLTVCGEFSFDEDVAKDVHTSDERKKSFIGTMNRILFPYLRSHVATVSALTDLGNVVIPLVNPVKLFDGMLE